MMRKGVTQLSMCQRDVLTVLGRLCNATQAQLIYWLSPKQPTVSKTLLRLEKIGMIQCERNCRPYIYTPTTIGRRAAGLIMPANRRFMSWSVMAHHCHRNAAEIRLRDHYPDFRFQQRSRLYALGFSPAHGEHYGCGEDGQGALVLLDDYLMPSSRIPHAWSRPHTPNTRYYDLAKGCIQHWCDITHHYILAVTDRIQYDKHKAYITKHQLNTALLFIDGLWQS